MFLYMHLAPASEGLRNSLSTRYSSSKGSIKKFSAPVFQDGNSQLFLYQPSLPPSLLFSILSTPSQNCCLHNLPSGPIAQPFLSSSILCLLPNPTKVAQSSAWSWHVRKWAWALCHVSLLLLLYLTHQKCYISGRMIFIDIIQLYSYSWVFPALDLSLQVLLQSVQVARWMSEGNTSHSTGIIFSWESPKRTFSWPIWHSHQNIADPNKPFQPSI